MRKMNMWLMMLLKATIYSVPRTVLSMFHVLCLFHITMMRYVLLLFSEMRKLRL